MPFTLTRPQPGNSDEMHDCHAYVTYLDFDKHGHRVAYAFWESRKPFPITLLTGSRRWMDFVYVYFHSVLWLSISYRYPTSELHQNTDGHTFKRGILVLNIKKNPEKNWYRHGFIYENILEKLLRFKNKFKKSCMKCISFQKILSSN